MSLKRLSPLLSPKINQAAVLPGCDTPFQSDAAVIHKLRQDIEQRNISDWKDSLDQNESNQTIIEAFSEIISEKFSAYGDSPVRQDLARLISEKPACLTNLIIYYLKSNEYIGISFNILLENILKSCSDACKRGDITHQQLNSVVNYTILSLENNCAEVRFFTSDRLRSWNLSHSRLTLAVFEHYYPAPAESEEQNTIATSLYQLILCPASLSDEEINNILNQLLTPGFNIYIFNTTDVMYCVFDYLNMNNFAFGDEFFLLFSRCFLSFAEQERLFDHQIFSQTIYPRFADKVFSELNDEQDTLKTIATFDIINPEANHYGNSPRLSNLFITALNLLVIASEDKNHSVNSVSGRLRAKKKQLTDLIDNFSQSDYSLIQTELHPDALKLLQSLTTIRDTPEKEQQAVTRIIRMSKVNEQKNHIEARIETYSERQFVVIATETSAELAQWIIARQALSPRAVAEIAKKYPSLANKLYDNNYFTTANTLDALMSLAELNDDIAQRVINDTNNPLITLSWQAKAVASVENPPQSLKRQALQQQVQRRQDDLMNKWKGISENEYSDLIRSLEFACYDFLRTREIFLWAYQKPNTELLLVNCIRCCPGLLNSDTAERVFSADNQPAKENLLAAAGTRLTKFNISPDKITAALTPAALFLHPDLNRVKTLHVPHEILFNAALTSRSCAIAYFERKDEDIPEQNVVQLWFRWPTIIDSCEMSEKNRLISLPVFENLFFCPDKRDKLSSRQIEICAVHYQHIAETLLTTPSYENLAKKLSEDQIARVLMYHSKLAKRFSSILKKIKNVEYPSCENLCRLFGNHPELADFWNHQRDSEYFKLLTAPVNSKSRYHRIAEILTYPDWEPEIITFLNSEFGVRISKEFSEDDWFALADSHDCLALHVFKTPVIRQNLSKESLQKLCLRNSDLFRLLLSDPDYKKPQILLQGDAQFWLSAAAEYPRFTQKILRIITAELRHPLSDEDLLRYNGNHELWQQLLTHTPAAQSKRLTQKAPLLVPSDKITKPWYKGEYVAMRQGDWYEKAYRHMNQKGCCFGFTLDFFRFALFHNDLETYGLRCDFTLCDKTGTSLPEEVDYLQKIQLFVTKKDTVTERKTTGLHYLKTDKIAEAVQRNKFIGLSAGNHIAGLFWLPESKQAGKDTGTLYYFESNTGIRHWKNFTVSEHGDELKNAILHSFLIIPCGFCKGDLKIKIFDEQKVRELDWRK